MWHDHKRLLIVCPVGSVTEIAYLRKIYEKHGVLTQIMSYARNPPNKDELKVHLGRVDAMLLVGNRRFSPRTRLPGPFLTDNSGSRIPAAWLPIRNNHSIRRFAEVIDIVHARQRNQPAIALLAQWHPHYLKLTERVESILSGSVPTFKWTTDVIGRDDLVSGLGSGLGMGLYLGHGRPQGWVGYYGMRAHHFEYFEGEPLGCMIALCCSTLSRRRISLSFGEALPLMGVTASYFGAVAPTRHTDNTRWAVRMSEALRNGASDIGQLVLLSTPLQDKAIRSYRIIGDPLAPLYTGDDGILKGNLVKTYP